MRTHLGADSAQRIAELHGEIGNVPSTIGNGLLKASLPRLFHQYNSRQRREEREHDK